jgi:hypothetical protein
MLLPRQRLGGPICRHLGRRDPYNLHSACTNFLLYLVPIDIDVLRLCVHGRAFLRQQINGLLVIAHNGGRMG